MKLSVFLCVFILSFLVIFVLPVFSADMTIGTASQSAPGLHFVDFSIIALYAVSMLLIGWHFSRKAKTTEDYLLGGRAMKPWSVGLSLFATLLSAISFLAVPGEIIQHGPVFLCSLLAYPIVLFVVGYWLIPFFMKLKVTSAYEILENKLGLSVRMTGSIIFLLTRLCWMALIIYLSATKVIVPIMGWSPDKTPLVCAALGVITVIYTSMGGLRAVVLTDVIQTFILISGAILTIVMVSVKMNGIMPWWPTHWVPAWDEQPLFSLNPHVRITIIGSVLMEFLWWLCTAGSDQMAIQRYLATRDAKSARRAFFLSMITGGAVISLLGVLGLALLGFFSTHPQLLPSGMTLSKDGDKLFPHFIVNMLPVGVSGLVISALIAASMSSLSSGVNSACSVITVDFLDRFRKNKETNETRHIKNARIISVVVGIMVVLLSIFMGKVPGNILEVTSKTNGLFVGPLFGLFFMAMFVPFATSFGTIWGAIYGFVAAAGIAYWDLLTNGSPLSWQLILPSALFVNIIIGPLLSLLPTQKWSRFKCVIFNVFAAIPIVVFFWWTRL